MLVLSEAGTIGVHTVELERVGLKHIREVPMKPIRFAPVNGNGTPSRRRPSSDAALFIGRSRIDRRFGIISRAAEQK